MTELNIRALLCELADPAYAAFQRKLLPTLPPERVIGVRTLDIRRLARRLSKTDAAQSFLASLPHTTYDENNLHAALLERIPDFETAMREVERFLPYIDNWATCDGFCPPCLYREPQRLWEHILQWLRSDEIYTVRYGLVRLTARYLSPTLFTPDVLQASAAVTSEDYYIRMAQAWLFSMALVKQYDTALPYLTEHRLSPWVHNKAIQKAIESYQCKAEIKAYLKTLKLTDKGGSP